MVFLKKWRYKALILKDENFNFVFDSDKCVVCGGKCCIGESGYIWIDENEIQKLADFFGILKDEFKEIYLLKFGNRYTIKEKSFEDGYACIFFDEKNKNCGIYEFRPSQCRSFPFWEHFKQHFDELEQECIAVKHL